MVTHLLRILLGHKFSPYSFRESRDFLPDLEVPNLGLYVHIPFCEELCSFCPYYKEKADRQKFPEYRAALQNEIALVAQRMNISHSRRQVSSLYFGGGSPAIMIDNLWAIRRKIDDSFEVLGNFGIELHPRDVGSETAKKLDDAGFDMVSLGIQSFSPVLLGNLGRNNNCGEASLKLLSRNGFTSIDVDLIFGIPGQTESDIRDDFVKAVELGAPQVSAYPFIDFSYASNRRRPQGRSMQRRMLDALLHAADSVGYDRTSIWTFAKRNTPRYSSVTRDNFLGFGPSAATGTLPPASRRLSFPGRPATVCGPGGASLDQLHQTEAWLPPMCGFPGYSMASIMSRTFMVAMPEVMSDIA